MSRNFQHGEFKRRDQEDTEKGSMPILCVLLISVLTLIAPRWIPFVSTRKQAIIAEATDSP